MIDNLINLIDKAVLDLQPFLEHELPTIKEQIKLDGEYIKVMCNLRDIDPKPYLVYYANEIKRFNKLLNSNLY